MDNSPGAVGSAAATSASIATDASLLVRSVVNMAQVVTSLESLASDAPWSGPGYFDAARHDEIEHLFFRFLVSRRVLVSLALRGGSAASPDENEDVADDGGGNDADDDDALGRALARAEGSFADDGASDATHALRTVIIVASSLAIFVYEKKLVDCFRGDRVAVAKLNERFYRSGIEYNTYDRLSLEVTDEAICEGRMNSLAASYDILFSEGSDVRDAIKGDDRAEELIRLADSLERELGNVAVDGSHPILNRVRHAPVADVARHVGGGTRMLLRGARAHAFKGVSRLKSPTAYLVRFSDEQKADAVGRLRPGDVILTYTAGYVSDVFIPGAFKHGITYVGSPRDRRDAGLTADGVARVCDDLPEGGVEALLRNFDTSSVQPLKAGERELDADVIEAVAEGVIFNNLARIMDTHVNRLLVLRPKISEGEMTDALTTVFRFLGDEYDFGFNFGDASAVVCTEVQYHAFNGKGGLEFQLTRRAGNPTLSADDIVNYYLANEGSFDFVLLALEDEESSCHDAKIHFGEEGRKVLVNLMTSESK